MKQARRFLGILFVSMVLAVACGPTAAPEAVPTETLTSTPAPTPQPASTLVPVTTNTPTPAIIPTPTAPPSPITFVMQDSYALGQDIAIKIRNNGTTKYFYSTYYPACNNLSFLDLSLKVRRIESFGETRELAAGVFLVPQGTHCDLAGDTGLLPGEEAVLITWGQQECVIDNWGCAESIPLPAGDYNILGRFMRASIPGKSRPPPNGASRYVRKNSHG